MFSTEVLLWVVTFLNLALTSCGLWAAITARSSWRALRQRLAERSMRSLRQLDAEMTELASSVSSQSATIRRLTSRLGMQDVRARRKEESSSTSRTLSPDPTVRKSQLRQLLSEGKLRVQRDGAGAAPAEDAGLNGTNHSAAD